MIARICKKKALQELHQNVKPDYFFDGETIGDFSFYYSYSLIFLCVSITLIITFTQTALMFLHLPQVMTDWQIVKYVCYKLVSFPFGPGRHPVEPQRKHRFLLLSHGVLMSVDQVEVLAWRESQLQGDSQAHF